MFLEYIVKGGTEDDCLLKNSKLALQIQLKVLYMELSGRTSCLLQYSFIIPKIMNIG